MRWPILILIALVTVLQYPLWLGKGGWLRVWEVDRQLQAQREQNLRLEQRNASLEAEVSDLKSGNEAIEDVTAGPVLSWTFPSPRPVAASRVVVPVRDLDGPALDALKDGAPVRAIAEFRDVPEEKEREAL